MASIRQFVKAVKDANPGLAVRYIPQTGEYRVTFADMVAVEREANAYYSSDRDDVAATARHMWEKRYLSQRPVVTNTVVQNGQAIKLGTNADFESVVTCDKCGRRFAAKFVYCVCRG